MVPGADFEEATGGGVRAKERARASCRQILIPSGLNDGRSDRLDAFQPIVGVEWPPPGARRRVSRHGVVVGHLVDRQVFAVAETNRQHAANLCAQSRLRAGNDRERRAARPARENGRRVGGQPEGGAGS